MASTFAVVGQPWNLSSTSEHVYGSEQPFEFGPCLQCSSIALEIAAFLAQRLGVPQHSSGRLQD
jgi:hypothetical protein